MMRLPLSVCSTTNASSPYKETARALLNDAVKHNNILLFLDSLSFASFNILPPDARQRYNKWVVGTADSVLIDMMMAVYDNHNRIA